MIVRDFDIPKILSICYEADSILVINSNAVLTFPVTMKSFQSVARYSSQIPKSLCGF